MNKYKLPYKIWYMVLTYHDKTTENLHSACAYTSYKKALIDYELKETKANNKYLTELIFELETNDDDKNLLYSEVLRNNMGDKI